MLNNFGTICVCMLITKNETYYSVVYVGDCSLCLVIIKFRFAVMLKNDHLKVSLSQVGGSLYCFLNQCVIYKYFFK